MPDRDIVLAKVAAIQRCLKRIKDVTGLKPDTLDELNVQDIFVLNLQCSTSNNRPRNSYNSIGRTWYT